MFLVCVICFALGAGCGKSGVGEEYAPKIYAVEQQEKAAAALRAGDSATAEECAARAIQHDPNYPEPYASMATVLARRGEIRQARSFLDMCIQRRPDFADGYLFRGVLNDELKESDAARSDYEAASKTYEQYAKEHPDDVEKRLKYAVTEYLRAGTPGLRLINALISTSPENHSVQFVKERMEAQDRAFAFRWITGQGDAGASGK